MPNKGYVPTKEHIEKNRQAKLLNPTRYWLGKKRYPETIEKMRIVATGKTRHSQPHTEETKIKISETKLNSPLTRRGENHPFWNGGNSLNYKREYHTRKFSEWRKSIFKRDNYTCQDCKKHGIFLTAHHLKSFVNHEELRFDINNGLTLCEECHMELHGLSRKKQYLETTVGG